MHSCRSAHSKGNLTGRGVSGDWRQGQVSGPRAAATHDQRDGRTSIAVSI